MDSPDRAKSFLSSLGNGKTEHELDLEADMIDDYTRAKIRKWKKKQGLKEDKDE